MTISIITNILDDHPDYAVTIKELLIHEGISEVRAYSDWRQMINAIHDTQAYVFIIDHLLGGITGLEVIEHIKRRCTFCKIIVVSGSSDFDVVVKYANADIRNYVVKGTELTTLVNYVKDARIELLKEINKIAKLREGVERNNRNGGS